MGVTIETWRARIGLHSQPNKSQKTTNTQGIATGGGSFPCRPLHILLVIGLLLLLSGNVELNPGPSSRQQLPGQNSSSKPYTNKDESFTTTEVLDILQNPDISRVVTEPPVKPRAGQAFLYHFTDVNKSDDWRCDQYHFHHDATREQPKADPKFKKLFFVIKTREGKDKRFKKHAYILLSEDNHLVLFQYIGDERIAEDLPHGNSKNATVPYIRLCPSVIRAIKDVSSNYTETLTCLNQQAASSDVPEVYTPRSRLHVINTRYRGLKDCTKEGQPNSLDKTGEPPLYHIAVSLTKGTEVNKIVPRNGKRKTSKRLQNPRQIDYKPTVRASPVSPENRDNLAPIPNKPDSPLDFGLVQPNTVLSASGVNNMPTLQSVIGQLDNICPLRGDEENPPQTINRENADQVASEAVDLFKTSLQDRCTTPSNTVTANCPAPTVRESSLMSSPPEDGSCQLSYQDNKQSDSDIVVYTLGESSLTKSSGPPAMETIGEQIVETQSAALEKFIYAIVNDGRLVKIIQLLHQIQATWNAHPQLYHQQHRVGERRADEHEVSANESSVKDSSSQSGISSSLPLTASTLITQVRRLWLSDFDMTTDLLLKTETVSSLFQQNTISNTLQPLLSSLVLGAFQMQTDVVNFMETLKDRPGHLRHVSGNSIMAEVSNDARLSIGRYTVTGQDLMKLNKSAWLDDSVIHAYLYLLEERCSKEGAKMFILECFLADFWAKKNYGEWLYKEVDMELSLHCNGVPETRWHGWHVPLMEYTWILMPICRHSHWILLAANIRNRDVCVINSKPSDSTQRDILQHWREYMACRSRETKEDLTAWKEIQCPVFPQTDGSSCGVYILMAVEALLSGVCPAVMRNCHVSQYREYVKQQLLNAAEMQTNHIEDNNVQSSEEVEITEITNSIDTTASKQHVEAEQVMKRISTQTFAIDSHKQSVELVGHSSKLEGEPSNDKAQGRLDKCGGLTDNSEYVGSMEITETSDIVSYDPHDITPELCPDELRSFCEELFQNQKSSFVALTLACFMKGRLPITSLDGQESTSPLKDYITWGCQLCNCKEATNTEIRNALFELEKLVLISEQNTFVIRRNMEMQRVLSTVIGDHLQEYIDIIDLKFIYFYIRTYKQDEGFYVLLKGELVEDLAKRFAKEILQRNLALVLSHNSFGYFHFSLLFLRAVKRQLKSVDIQNILENTDKTFGGTFIHWMCFGRNAELFKSLSFCLKDHQKAACLIPCCISGNSSIVELLSIESDLTDCQENHTSQLTLPGIAHSMDSPLPIIESYATHDLPPLHLASLYGHTGIVSHLLENGFDVNAQLVKGSETNIPFLQWSTAALAAATKGNIDVVKCLIQHGADLNLHDIMFNAPIHSACRSGNCDLVALVIGQQCCISEGDAEGNTPLHIACERGESDIVSLLLENGADCILLNYKNEMPLDIACKEGFLDVAMVILSQKGYPLPYDGSNTPLHKACAAGFTDIIELLLLYDADRSVTVDDQHPLLTAAYSNNVDVVRILLNTSAAKVVICDSNTLSGCLRKEHTGVVKLLLEKGANVTDTDRYGYSPLERACVKGDIEIVKLLLEKGASVTDTDWDGYSPLARACEKGDIEIVKLLLEKGASVTDTDDDGYSVLALACEKGDIEMVKLLLEKGASVTDTDMNGYSVLALACKKRDMEMVKLLLEKGASVTYTDMNGYSPLERACEKGDIEIVKLLLEKGAGVTDADMDWYSVLTLACEKGDIEIVKLLLEKGASVTDTDRDGYSPLERACIKGDIEIVKLLLEKGACVTDTDMDGYSPLARACEKGDIEIVKLLLEKGATVTDTDMNGYSPLNIACVKGDIEIVKLLLEKGACVTDTDMNGYSPLTRACEKGDIEIVKLLLEKGASVSDSNRSRYSPLARACVKGDIEIVKLLLEKGASVTDTDMNGYSPLARACEKGDIEIVKLLLEKGASVTDTDMDGYSPLARACEKGDIEIIKLLLEKGASVTDTDLNGYSVLALACEKGDMEIVKLLLEKGACVTYTDMNGCSLLNIACFKGDIEIVKLLLEKGASVTDTDLNGYSVLALACEKGDMEMVKLLLEKGASVTYTDMDGYSLLNIACLKGDIEIVKLLLEKGASVTYTDMNGCSLLNIACFKGDIEIVKLLLEKGASVTDTDMNLCSLLNIACFKGDIEMVKLLLENGASVTDTDMDGYSPLTRACKKGDIEIVKLLLEKFDSVTYTDRSRYSVLTLACEKGDIEIVQLLLEKGASVTDTDRDGYSPLEIACKKGDIEIVKLLLEKCDSVTDTDRSRYSLLNIACEKGDIEIVKLLLEKGACVTDTDIHGYVPRFRTCGEGACLSILYHFFRLSIKRLQQVTGIIDILPILKWAFQNKHYVVFRMLLPILPSNKSLDFFLQEVCCFDSPQALIQLTEKCNAICFHITLTAAENVKNIKCIEILNLLDSDDAVGIHLHRVVACGYMDLVKNYFEKFLSSHHLDACVMIASRYGHTAIVEWLLHKCCKDITYKKHSGRSNVLNIRTLFYCVSEYRKDPTALFEACYQGHIDVVRLLLQHEMYGSDQAISSSLHLVCKTGNTDILQLLLDSGAHVDHVDQTGNTGLYISTINARDSAVQLLLENGANPSHVNNKGKTPLLAPAEGNIFTVMIVLLRYTTSLSSVPVSVLNNAYMFKLVSENIHQKSLAAVDSDGNSLLHQAVRFGFTDSVATLLKRGVDGSLTNDKKETAMHIAAERGCQKTVRLLIQYHHTSNVGNMDKLTPLHCAASEGHLNVVKDLTDCDSNVSLKGCLHLAAKLGHTETVQHLINKGAVTNETDHQGDTPLHHACESGNIETVNVLLSSKADVNAQGHKGRTPLHIACARGYDGIVGCLLDHNGDPNLRNKFNNTPLLSAVVEGHLDVIKLMMLKGAKSEITGAEGSNYLIACCFRGHRDVARYLIESGAQISSKDIQCISPFSISVSDISEDERDNIEYIQNTVRSGIEGMTSLHAAIDAKHFDLAEYLINQGADVLENDQYGKSILVKICENGNSKVTKAFVSSDSALPSVLRQRIIEGFSVQNTPDSRQCIKKFNDSVTIRETGNVIEVIDEPDTDSVPPVKVACDCGHDDVASILIAYSAGWLTEMGDSHLYEGKSPLHLAYDAGFMDVVACLLSSATDLNAVDSSGYTIFHKACEHGDMETLQNMLKFNVDIKQTLCMKSKDGEMLCHIASRKGHIDILRMLLKEGMDLTHLTDESDNVLHLACSYDKHKVCTFLLDTCPNLAWIKDRNGYTPLHIAMRRGSHNIVRIFFAHAKLAQYGRMQNTIWMYLCESMDNINRLNVLVRCSNVMNLTDDHGNTPFHIAAKTGSSRAIDYLLKHDRKDCVKLKNSDGDTPLHFASYIGHSVVVRLLSPNFDKDVANNLGDTPLHLSCLNAQRGSVLALLSAESNVNAENSYGDTPLYLVIHSCRAMPHVKLTEILVIIQHLLAHGADPCWQDINGNTPLHVACSLGKIEIVACLLTYYKDLNIINRRGKTPVHVACEYDHRVIVDLLLEVMWFRASQHGDHGVYTDNIDHEYGETSLHIACRRSSVRSVSLLLEHGASTSIKDNNGNMPVFVACEAGCIQVVRQLLPYSSYQDLNRFGETLLLVACRNGHMDMFQIILEWVCNGADRNIVTWFLNVPVPNHKNMTALHISCSIKNVYFVEQLLVHGATPSIRDVHGQTALHYSCINGCRVIVSALLQYMTDVSVCDSHLRTPLHYACECGYLDIAETLVMAGGDLYVRDRNGRTPLDMCSNGDMVLLKRSLRNMRKRQSTSSEHPPYSSKRAKRDPSNRRGCTFEDAQTCQSPKIVPQLQRSQSMSKIRGVP